LLFLGAVGVDDRLGGRLRTRIVRVNRRKTTLRRTTARCEQERIGLGKADLARGPAQNNARDSSLGRGSNLDMTLMILRQSFEEPLAVNTILVFTLAVAASLNAWCLSAYL